MKKLSNYIKDHGLILNYCEIKITKSDKQVKYTHREMKVIISNEKDYVIENYYGGLEILDKMGKYKYSRSSQTVNKVSVGEQRWGMKSLDDYIYCRCISTFSEKVTKTRIKKALCKFINAEAYFYVGLEQEIERQLLGIPS